MSPAECAYAQDFLNGLYLMCAVAFFGAPIGYCAAASFDQGTRRLLAVLLAIMLLAIVVFAFLPSQSTMRVFCADNTAATRPAPHPNLPASTAASSR